MRVDPKILAFERHEAPEGMATVIFSTSLVMNMVNGALFLGAPFDAKVVAGGALGRADDLLMLKKKAGAFNPKTISDLKEIMAQIGGKPHALSLKIKIHDQVNKPIQSRNLPKCLEF